MGGQVQLRSGRICRTISKGKAVPLGGLEWPRVFQEVKVPRFQDNITG